MLEKKNIFILLGVLAAVVLIAVIIEGMGKRDKKKAEKASILFPGFAADRVSSIDIKTKDRKVKLNKEGDTWLVATADNYPADAEAVQAALDKVKEMKSTFVASKSADRHSLLEVDEESGVGVAMLGSENGEVLAHFFAGKMGNDFMSTYVRKVDQNEVLLVEGYLRNIFDKGIRGWRDRTIFNFDTEQAQKLTLTSKGKGNIVINTREDGGWQIIEPEIAPAEKDVVDGIISQISKLSADDFAEKEEPAEQTDTEIETEQPPNPLAEYKLDDPQSKVMVDLNDDTVRILLVGDLSGQKYYVKREGKDTVFLLPKGKIDSIFKTLEDLKAEPEEPEEVPPGAESIPE